MAWGQVAQAYAPGGHFGRRRIEVEQTTGAESPGQFPPFNFPVWWLLLQKRKVVVWGRIVLGTVGSSLILRLLLRQAGANVAIKEQYEGAESREFWEGLGHNSRVADRSLYLSLAEKPKENRYDHTPRLFHLTSWTGQFRADEVAPSSRFPQLPCPYPLSLIHI